MAAAIDFVTETPDGAVILTITGDEEDVAIDGTTAILDWMAGQNERMTDCLVGEPTCPNTMGEMMKIGRRGSMTVWLSAQGVQGHSAYPHRAKNAVAAMAQSAHGLAPTSWMRAPNISIPQPLRSVRSTRAIRPPMSSRPPAP